MHDIEKKQVESGGLTTSLNFFLLVRRPPAPALARPLPQSIIAASSTFVFVRRSAQRPRPSLRRQVES